MKSPMNELDTDPGMQALFAELDTVVETKSKDKLEDKSRSSKSHGSVPIKDEEAIKEVQRMENSDDNFSIFSNVFWRADLDENGELDIQELSRWIHAKIVEHIERAMRQNIGRFTAIDNNPRNGY